MSFSREIIKKFHLKLSKKFGQNFLVDDEILHSIIGSAQITKEDLVLEIGPGAGALTIELANKAGFVLAVEIDKQLIPVLQEVLKDFPNALLLEGDGLKINFSPMVKEMLKKYNLKRAIVVANLPYYITTPLLFKFLEEEDVFQSYVFMVQKEVALRMVADPGKKDYGALSVAVRFYTDPSIEFEVPPSSFVPEPEVQSAVVRLKTLSEPPYPISDKTLFFKVVKAAFGQRRKTLMNTLRNNFGHCLTKEQILDILSRENIEANRRGETLTFLEFARLSNEIHNMIYNEDKKA